SERRPTRRRGFGPRRSLQVPGLGTGRLYEHSGRRYRRNLWVRWARLLGYGGVSPELISKVHEEVQAYRATKGLKPWDFSAHLGKQARGRKAGAQKGLRKLRQDAAAKPITIQVLSAGAGR